MLNSTNATFDFVNYWEIATPESLAVTSENGSGIYRIHHRLTQFTPGDIFDYSFQIIIAVLILIINGFVMYVLATTSTLYTPTNLIIGSLALSDFGIGLARPLGALLELGILKDYDICLFSYCSTVALCTVSIQHLTFVSIDRYIRIKQPFRYRDIVSKGRVTLLIVFLWISGFSVAFLPMVGFIREDFDGSVCSAEYFMKPWFFYVVTSVSFLVTSAVLTFIYTRIFLIARRKKKLYVTKFTRREHMSSTLRNLKAAKLLAVLCLYFLVSWMPFLTLRYIAVIRGKGDLFPNIVERITAILAACNSIGNPLLYAYGERNIRGAMKRQFFSKFIQPKQKKGSPVRLLQHYRTCMTSKSKEIMRTSMKESNFYVEQTFAQKRYG